MAAKFSLYRRTIPEIFKPEGASVEWRLIAWGWMVRRLFLRLLLPFTLCLLALLAGCDNFQTLAKHYDEMLTKEKIGVLAHTDITWPKSTAALRRALKFFREENVDRVVFLGDPTKDGYKNQMEVFEAAWTESFKGVKPPERVLAEEQHEIGGINFSGYGRMPLTDLFCVQPLNGKTINAGSMRGIVLSSVFKSNPELTKTAAASAQGLLVCVRNDGMQVRRMDFSGKMAEDVGDPWWVDDAGLIHAAGAKAPEFWPDTRLTVIRGYGKNGETIYTLRWPPVLAKFTGERAFSYSVFVGDREFCQVQSRGFYLPESRDTAAVDCLIAESELNGALPKFAVAPVSSLSQSGRLIRAE